MPVRSSSQQVVYAALAGNILVAITKFGAAAWTGSSAMLSEAIHSLVDTSNEVLLLYGMHRAKQPPDAAHLLGHGRELYFWSFIVALLTFMLGAGASVYQGITHILHGTPMVDPAVNYVVLALSALFEGTSWFIALKNFRRTKRALGYYEALRRSKDPPSFLVLLEDSAALIGLGIAFAGTLAATWLQMPMLDGVASIVIGLMLGATAVLVARESKGLLIGESADPHVIASILQIAATEPGIERANGVLTVHLAPRQVVAALSLEFADELTTPQIEARVTELERKIRQAHPEVIALFVKPQSPGTFQAARGRPFAAS
jgi:cation diffusion facilitator family transporter